VRGLVLILLASTCSAQTSERIERGTMRILIPVHGTVRAEKLIRIRSTISGRIETVTANKYQWVKRKQSLGTLLDRDFAAMIDAKTTTPTEIIEKRWAKVYRPIPFYCPTECFIMKVFAKEDKWIEHDALLIEAAKRLRLVGRVRPGKAHWIEEGQLITYWNVKNPKKKIQGRIENLILDTQGKREKPGATFTVRLTSKHYLKPNAKWKGEIVALVKKKTLRIPTAALLHFQGETYLPILISTGITTERWTEITAGVSVRDKYLNLDDSQLGELKRHSPQPPKRTGASRRRSIRRGGARDRGRSRKQRDRYFEPNKQQRRPKKRRPQAPITIEAIEDTNTAFPSDL